MANRTYKYFHGEPLYAFGHGLSYTTFSYENLRANTDALAAGSSVTISVDVTNTGSIAGDEVVQLYVSYPESSVARPIRELRGFDRITLAPGETGTVSFSLEPADVAYWNTETESWTIEPGTVSVEVGASSSDIRVSRSLSVRP